MKLQLLFSCRQVPTFLYFNYEANFNNILLLSHPLSLSQRARAHEQEGCNSSELTMCGSGSRTLSPFLVPSCPILYICRIAFQLFLHIRLFVLLPSIALFKDNFCQHYMGLPVLSTPLEMTESIEPQEAGKSRAPSPG